MPGTGPPVQRVHDRLILHVRLSPKGGANAVTGIEERDGKFYLRIEVAALPEDGKANAALIAVLSEWLDIPKSSIALISGHRSRIKTLAAAGGIELFDKAARLLDRLSQLRRQGRALHG